jgi:hypothetical protein
MNAIADWRDLLAQPTLGDHIVQVYEDTAFLAEAVAQFAGTGLERGEGVVLIVTPEHRSAFEAALAACGLDAAAALARGQLHVLDAERTLALFMRGGMPDWTQFHSAVGGTIARLRLDFPAVRAYGEMVDLLWQRGERDAAIRLEECWNELVRLQTFSLFCAYRMDALDIGSYGGPLECVCKAHTHLIPARDYGHLDEAVAQAARDALGESLSRMLLSLAATHPVEADMPHGQAVLLWLKKNMPLTAEKVLAGVRARC